MYVIIFLMSRLLERMDPEHNIDEEERVQRIIEGMLPEVAAMVVPYEVDVKDAVRKYV
jgi:hypothetical protein